MAIFIMVFDDTGSVLESVVGLSPPLAIMTNESLVHYKEVTGFPIEDGANLSDHARHVPFLYEVEFKITDSPHGPVNTWVVDSGGLGVVREGEFTPTLISFPPFFGGDSGPPVISTGFATQSVVAAIKGRTAPLIISPSTLSLPNVDWLRDTRSKVAEIDRDFKLVTVWSSVSQHRNMLMVKNVFTRDSNQGKGGTLSLGFLKIKRVKTSTVDAPDPEEPRGAGKVSGGSQSATNTGLDSDNPGGTRSILKKVKDAIRNGSSVEAAVSAGLGL